MSGKRLVVVASVASLLAVVLAWATRPSQRPPPVVTVALPSTEAVPTGGLVQAAPPAQATVRVESPVADRVDWNQRYSQSPDLFALTAEMAGAALAGDARAAYLIGQVLLECKVEQLALKPYTYGTIADRVEAYLVTSKTVSEPRRAAYRRRVARCERLFSADPFAAFDLPAAAREFQYWRDSALVAGDPLAVTARAARTMMKFGSADDPEVARGYREELFRDIRVAVTSRDPRALLEIGGLLTNPSLVDSADSGLAWLTAACQSGYDCSNANPDIGRGCVEAGTCDAGSTTLDVLQRDLSPAEYAAIYAAGQDILYKVTNDDWDGLQQYLAIK